MHPLCCPIACTGTTQLQKISCEPARKQIPIENSSARATNQMEVLKLEMHFPGWFLPIQPQKQMAKPRVGFGAQEQQPKPAQKHLPRLQLSVTSERREEFFFFWMLFRKTAVGSVNSIFRGHASLAQSLICPGSRKYLGCTKYLPQDAFPNELRQTCLTTSSLLMFLEKMEGQRWN